MNIYLIDPLTSPIEVLFDNLNKLFDVPYFTEKRFEQAMNKSFLHYYNGNLYREYMSQLTYEDTSTGVCDSAEEFTSRILEGFLEELL